jgi:hypothetical protein
MELVLNLAGAFVALAMVCLWLRWAPREGHDRRTELVALALLILILFPVISVTDDLLAAQNPAETDSCVRRDQVTCFLQQVSLVAAGLPEVPAADPSVGCARLGAPGALPALVVNSPALAPIENRPPPAA